MKLVFAIVNNDDSKKVIADLNFNKYKVTVLSSTGGFLKSGNTTLLIGVNKEKVQDIINIIKCNCKNRKQVINSAGLPIIPTHVNDMYSNDTFENISGIYNGYNDEVEVGGATIFVINSEKNLI